MTDLYDQRIDEMKARERYVDRVWRQRLARQKDRNTERLAAYKRKRTAAALKELQRLGQEWDNG